MLKSDGELRAWAGPRLPWLAAGVFLVLGLAFSVALTVDAGAVAQGHLRARPCRVYWVFRELGSDG